ncbi:MAG: serine/threonine-protein kinase [Planctomycetota bacterium]
MGVLSRLTSFFSGRLDVHSRFDLERKAISGTMSKFYMARDGRSGEIVGLKILDPTKTAQLEARFKGLKKPTEGQIAVRLVHPYIVKTYEHGLTTDGSQYLVMEFLEGPGMNSILIARDDKLLDGRRLTFLRQAAEALATVHAAGFIHRDVCPRNLILTGDRETVKLTDFGLAVPATEAFMRPGNRTGTPDYMAPELARRRPTDKRLDVFAFGATAYEICTYELPWRRGVTGAAAMTHDQPAVDIREHRPQIHPQLAAAIHASIEPDVNKRLPSMERFLHAIRNLKHEDKE